MTESTRNSINTLYKVFSKYPLNPNMKASPLYSKLDIEEWNKEISHKPLQELHGDELSFLAFKVGYTWGNIIDYKHFLPRFFELIAKYNEGLIQSFIVFNKLKYFDWENWPQEEFDAILDFINSLWIQIINDETQTAKFEEIFSSIIKLHPFKDWLLQQWLDAKSNSAIYQFCNFIYFNSPVIVRQNQISSFQEYNKNSSEIEKLFIDWAKIKMKHKLETTIHRIQNEALKNDTKETLEILNKC